MLFKQMLKDFLHQREAQIKCLMWLVVNELVLIIYGKHCQMLRIKQLNQFMVHQDKVMLEILWQIFLKLKNLLGYKPQFTVREGLKITWDYFKNNKLIEYKKKIIGYIISSKRKVN